MPVARNVWQHVDAGSPAADAPPLDHRQHHPAPERPPAQHARPVTLKQRRLHVLDAAGGGEIRLDRLLGPVVVAAAKPASLTRHALDDASSAD